LVSSEVPFSGYDRLYVGGEWIAPSTGAFDEIPDPATESVFGRAPVGGVRGTPLITDHGLAFQPPNARRVWSRLLRGSLNAAMRSSG